MAMRADPRLVRQVMGAVITQESGELGGHRYQRVEQASPLEAVVWFQGRFMGFPFSTVDRVVESEAGLTFHQVEGYLPAVEEEMTVSAIANGSLVTYRGHFRPRPGPFGRVLGPLLAPLIYRREARRSLRHLKSIAESRQARSAMFRTRSN